MAVIFFEQTAQNRLNKIMKSNLTDAGGQQMELIETMIMVIEAFMQLAIGLLKFIAVMYLFVLIISNPLVFLFMAVFCPGLFTFVISLMLMSSGSGRR